MGLFRRGPQGVEHREKELLRLELLFM